MQITFLGTGTSQGIPVLGCPCKVCTSSDTKDKRLRCSILITHEKKNYVIDVGPDFRTQMLKENVTDLESVLLTHEHNDHIIGLDDLRPYIFKSKKEMQIFGMPRVLDEIRERFKYAFVPQPYPGAPKFVLQGIEAGTSFSLDNLLVEPIKVHHGSLEILGFKIGNFAYLTDVKSLPDETIEKIRGIEHLVISSLRKGKPHHSHLVLEETIELIRELKPVNAYLTHLSHRMGKHEEISKELPKGTKIAYDGYRIRL